MKIGSNSFNCHDHRLPTEASRSNAMREIPSATTMEGKPDGDWTSGLLHIRSNSIYVWKQSSPPSESLNHSTISTYRQLTRMAPWDLSLTSLHSDALEEQDGPSSALSKTDQMPITNSKFSGKLASEHLDTSTSTWRSSPWTDPVSFRKQSTRCATDIPSADTWWNCELQEPPHFNRKLGLTLLIVWFLPASILACGTNSWVKGIQMISGVISTSTGVALIPLQLEHDVDVLQWMYVIPSIYTRKADPQQGPGNMGDNRALLHRFNLHTHSAKQEYVRMILVASSIKLTRARYLFCTLLLAVHFNVGFVQTTDKGLDGIVTYGPLVFTLCAALMSIPFRKRSRRTTTNLALNDLPTPTRQETSSRLDGNISNDSNSPSIADSSSESDIDPSRIAAGVTGFAT
jgi:hypothetical protein